MSAPVPMRFLGPWGTLSAADRTAFLDRSPSANSTVVRDAVSLVADVRARGDVALREQVRRFDGVELESLEVPRPAMRRALDGTPRDLRRALDRAIRNLDSVHSAFQPVPQRVQPEPGITIGRRPDPLDRVGIYAPGGRAAYPSSVLMAAVPARIAGVREVILASPPGPNSLPSDTVLAAAQLAGVHRVFSIGGAGAIAAMAFGTESVPRVDRIVGPGNAYVAAAKLLVVGDTAIDAPAGPSELMVVCDATADPDIVAGEMLAQAEHDPLACVVAVAVGVSVAAGILRAINSAVTGAARRDTVLEAFAGQGGVITVSTIDEATDLVRNYAPEHLLLSVDDPGAVLPAIRNVGTVFVGHSSSVAFGDYMTGANHVLPTGGAARSYSGLSTADFVRWTTWQAIEPAAARSLADDVAIFASSESLPGHAAAAARWSASR